MTIEEKLKLYILERYLTMANFSNACGIGQTTLSAIFKRGVGSCTAKTLYSICDILEISMDALFNGLILPRGESEYKEYTDYDYIFDRMLINKIELSDYEKFNMRKSFYNSANLVKENRDKLFNDGLLCYETKDAIFIYNKRTNESHVLNREEAIQFISDSKIDFKDIEFVKAPELEKEEAQIEPEIGDYR